MTTAEQLEQRISHIRETIWTEDYSPAGVLIATSAQEAPEEFTTDDCVSRWIFRTNIPNLYILITKEIVLILYSGENAPEKIADLAVPEKVIIQKIDGSVSDVISENASGEIVCTTETSDRSELASVTTVADSAKIETLLIVHAATEFTNIRNAGRVAVSALKKIFKKQMEDSIESDEITSLKSLSKVTEKAIKNPTKLISKIQPEDVEEVFVPAVQSGTEISVDFPPKTGDSNLTIDFVNAVIGVRYKSFVAVVGRTYIFNGSNEVKEAYKTLREAHEAAIKECQPGKKFSEIYAKFIETLGEKYAQYAPEVLGGFTGTIMLTQNHLITKDSEEVVPNESSLLLKSSLENVKTGTEPPFTLSIIDTLQITESKENEQLVTKETTKYKKISYSFSKANDVIEELLKDDRPIYERTRNKTDQKKVEEETEEDVKYFEKLQQKRESAHAVKEVDEDDEIEEAKSFESNSQFDYRTADKIEILRHKMTVLLPISGVVVPFHISCIKQADSSSNDTESQIVIKFETPKATDPEAKKYFIKELSFTRKGNNNFDEIAKEIKKMKKNYKDKLKKEKELKSIFRDEPLKQLENKPGKGIPRLTGIHIRPTPQGKKTSGSLEAHANGFKFRSPYGRYHVIYRNIRLAIYQLGESDNEMSSLIHLYLKKPIIPIGGGTPTSNIQFYKPIGDTSIDVSKTTNSGMTDQAEFAEEEHDRKVRKRINKEFKTFIKAFKDPDYEFEHPPEFERVHKTLVFEGTYQRQKVNIYPMTSSVVSVVDQPPLVLLVDDIEVAVFEREQGGNYFDLTFVYSDWSKEPLQIMAIPTYFRANIKRWMDALKIEYYSSATNVDWKSLLITLNKSGHKSFNEDGGWENFFAVEEEDENDEDPAYNDDDDDDDAVIDDDEDEEFDAVDDEDDDDMPIDDDEDDGGKSWKQLDEEAAEADRRKEKSENRHHHHHHHHHHH